MLTLDRYPHRAAEAGPDNLAFAFGQTRMSHARLAGEAGALARLLSEHGVRRGTMVGVCMDRALEAAVAIYAVLRLGAVFVPLDPAAPVARHADIIRRTGMVHLIAHDGTRAQIDALRGAGACPALVFGLGDGGLDWQAHRGAPEYAGPGPGIDDLAYVIFTSGSTGVPKGVMHTHASGAAYAEMSAAMYDLRPGAVMANHAPTHFDVATMGLFAAPCGGAGTYFLSQAEVLLPASQARLLADAGITHWYSLVSVIVTLFSLEGIEALDLSALRWVLFCGEAMANADLRRLMQRFPQATFSQSYGPTEVNQCTYHHFDALPPDNAEHPVIGRDCPDCRSLLVDPGTGEPVTQGEVGEYLISAPTMMRGYFDDPARDAEAFVTIQTGHGPERYYATGDLMRRDADGLLHFHGRQDRLVRYRGIRLELDEVEAVLDTFPGVARAAAMLNADGTDLLAAVEPAAGQSVDPAAIMAHAAGHLPRLSVPRRIAVLDNFPQTGSGKTDRIALLPILEAASEDGE